MNNDIDTGDDEADGLPGIAVPAPVENFAFAAVTDLLNLVTDPRGCTARLKALKRELDALADARAALAAEQAAFTELASNRAREMDVKAGDLRKREVAVHLAEARLAEREEVVAAYHRDQRDRQLEHVGAGGLTREIDRGGDDEADPHFRIVEEPAFAAAEASPPRKSMRRGAET
jgi:hypothetical protein